MRNYHISGLPGLFMYAEMIQRIQNGRPPHPVGGAAAPILNGDAMIRGENDPVGSEVRLDNHPDFVAMFPRPTRAPTTGTTTTATPTTGNGRGWLRTAGSIALGLLGVWFVLFLFIPALTAAFGSPSWNWKNGAIAIAQAEAADAKKEAAAAKVTADDAKKDAADAKKAADDAKAAAALADAKAKGASAEARTVSQINLCPGGSKANCIALLKADGLSDLGAEEGCAPTCVAP